MTANPNESNGQPPLCNCAAQADITLWSMYVGIGAAVYELHNLRRSESLPPFVMRWEDDEVMDMAIDFANRLMRRRAEEIGGQP